MTVTAKQVRDAVAAAGLTWMYFRQCSVCLSVTNYQVYRGMIFYNGSCWTCQNKSCEFSAQESGQRSWEDIADLINRQNNDADRIEIASKFGLKLEGATS